MDDAPAIKVERYEDEYLMRVMPLRELAKARGDKSAENPPLFDLPDGVAVVTDTVQLYLRPVNYDDIRLDNGVETSASHAKACALLHLLYNAGDRAVEGAGGQRVDWHGARMHAVVIEPRGSSLVSERIAAALKLADDMIELSKSARSTFLSELGVDLKFRVGIDVGPCVAINSGRSDEREPMFIGPAANHAAKLAMGDTPGVYLSDRIREAMSLRQAGSLIEEKELAASDVELAQLRVRSVVLAETSSAKERFGTWERDVRENRVNVLRPSDFAFHRHSPPLRSIDYAQLTPANSIRMPIAAIFADLDEYTKYIDRCMGTGNIAEAVRLLHVIRSELNAVVQSDFGGRKVRFIGNSILGILAEGSSIEIDEGATVNQAALCAGALRSSFSLCAQLMPEARQLGLAIGFELGQTPITRIGIRGERAVRAASSLTVRASEACQRECEGTETKIGASAYEKAGLPIKVLFANSHKASNLTYDIVAGQIDPGGVSANVSGAPKTAAGTVAIVAASAIAATEPARAYVAK